LIFYHAIFSSQGFVSTLIGPAGSNAVISASSDLQTWTPIITNSLPSGITTFIDSLSPNSPARFYRATLLP
jgi:hypothetical protein